MTNTKSNTKNNLNIIDFFFDFLVKRLVTRVELSRRNMYLVHPVPDSPCSHKADSVCNLYG